MLSRIEKKNRIKIKYRQNLFANIEINMKGNRRREKKINKEAEDW